MIKFQQIVQFVNVTRQVEQTALGQRQAADAGRQPGSQTEGQGRSYS